MTAQPSQPKSRWKLVVLGLFAFSTLVGVVSYWRFIVSDRYLRQDIVSMAKAGKSLTVEQCVTRTVSWASTCRAMKSLCVSTSPHLMKTCLVAQDRRGYCDKLGVRGQDTHFGYHECKARKVDRQHKKICAAAYRAIASYCEKKKLGASRAGARSGKGS
jgi:hypothetical protein